MAPSTTVYGVDASSWIALWEEHYPPSIFPGIYSHIQKLAATNAIRCPKVIRDEVGGRESEVGRWIRSLAIPPDSVTPKATAVADEIRNKYPKLVKPGAYNAGDPWLIALAEVNGWTVVTSEKMGDANRPRIPLVCYERSVPCVNVVQFFHDVKLHLP